MSLKNYQFLCEHCGYKRFTNGTDIQDLREITTSAIQRGVPKLDVQAKKTFAPSGLHQPSVISTGTTQPPALKQVKKFKCPTCGFVIKAKQVQFIEDDYEQTNRVDGRETGASGSSLPGELA